MRSDKPPAQCKHGIRDFCSWCDGEQRNEKTNGKKRRHFK